MKKFLLALPLLAFTALSFAQEVVYVHDTVYIAKAIVDESVEIPAAEASAEETPVKNNWGAKLKDSNFHIGLDLQTKYVWRGIEMIVEDACPVAFPCINYQWNGLYIYTMGGYALNGKYSELDMGISYTWRDLTVSLNDYFYPDNNNASDKYFTGGKDSKHWLEVCVTYTPEKAPVWITASNFFYSPTDVYMNEDAEVKKAYSTYFEVGTYYDFLNNNRLSLAVGMTPFASWYNNYQQMFSVCNVDLKYTYIVDFKKTEWTLPLSAEFIYNPVYEKPYFNFIANFAF